MKHSIKKGFTFAELMISLVVIAVITAILYPTISELAPNNNKQLFKSAYKTIELVLSDLNAESTFTTDSNDLCERFEAKLNTINDSTDRCTSGANDLNHFTTTNGVRWFFTTDGNNARIIFDVNASNNNMATREDRTGAQGINNFSLTNNGNNIWTNGNFINPNNATFTDTFAVDINPAGKIISISDPGRAHLRDED